MVVYEVIKQTRFNYVKVNFWVQIPPQKKNKQSL